MMARNTEKTYTQTTILLDGGEFEKCVFDRCVLEYGGTAPVYLNGCSFKEIEWRMVGAASNTIQFLEGLYHGLGPGGRSVVESTFANIRKQKTPGLHRAPSA